MHAIKQLWEFTDKNCKLPAQGGIINGEKNKIYSKVPVMHWPDGSVCWPVTSWLLSRYKNLSTKTAKGGSIGTYAAQISHLVRFVHRKGIRFDELVDEHMYDWANDLRNETDLKNGLFKRRDQTQVGRIMRRGFDFLISYQETFLINKIIIGNKADGASIKVTKKEMKRKKYSICYLDHPAIPKNDVPQDVKPIGHSSISALYDAISKSTKSKYVLKRRQNLLRLLEATGGRRVELSELLCSDILHAIESEKLRMRVAKAQSENKYREVPIDSEWIKPIYVFIKTYRQRLVKIHLKRGNITHDSDHLFLSEVDGKKLSEETITKEISILKKIAGINEKICAHMFRHRFITHQVIYRLKNYVGQELPMDTAHVILTKVASITGHSNPLSLMPYIDLAYQEMGVWDTAEKVLMMKSKIEAGYRIIQILKHDVEAGILNGKALVERVLETLQGVLGEYDHLQSSDNMMLFQKVKQ